MRSISIDLLVFVLMLEFYGCYGSRERSDRANSRFDGTDGTIMTGGIGGVDTDDNAGMGDAPCAPNCPDINWVTIPGGTFMMGSAERIGRDNGRPQHEVAVRTFKMSKTEVTIAQYGICVDAGICPIPTVFDESSVYKWDEPSLENPPIIGVNWFEAKEYAQWLGARLPSEAEWEYEACNGGQDVVYAWGNEEASCEYAVIGDHETGKKRENKMTAGVCSKPLDNTAQGLCDMVGNDFEWVEDDWHASYSCAPSDGQAWIDNPRSEYRILGSCSWGFFPSLCRSASRFGHYSDDRFYLGGFRVALD